MSSSEGEEDEDAESIMSAEVDLKNSDQTKTDEDGRNSEILTSTGKPVEGGQTEGRLLTLYICVALVHVYILYFLKK